MRSVLFESLTCLCLIQFFFVSSFADDAPPRSLDPRLKIELFAEAPQIVTPTGIDIDQFGRIWAIESNTHQTPEGYAGHPSDRILVMQPAADPGKVDAIVVFKDGFTHAMSIAIKPVWLSVEPSLEDFAGKDSSNPAVKKPRLEVYIATRREIFLCTDEDGDLKCDNVKTLVRLDTTGNYPHNGLAGFAFDALGHLFFGFGENLGVDYKVIGSDGTTLAGGGEGGSIFRCLPDGSKLERWATGFWNPHASCCDAFDRMFSVDNDPDSRPPCRLMHIVRDGDYGYRFRNGRKGTHPFTSWNGEIVGTLPMVSGTGEAPSGIVAYESDGLPADYIGTLLVGSWGDHRIDKFVLKPRGISFQSMPQPVIQGGENFRPVGLAVAPDGSLYFTDWVSKEYKVHSKGRIWRVSAIDKPAGVRAAVDPHQTNQQLAKALDSPVLTTRRLAATLLAKRNDGRKLLEQFANERSLSRRQFESSRACPGYTESESPVDPATADLADPFIMSKLINQTAALFVKIVDQVVVNPVNNPASNALFAELKRLDPSANEAKPQFNELRQMAKLLAMRLKFSKERSLVNHALNSQIPAARRLGVQWIGEERFLELRPEVEKMLASEPMTADLFRCCIASLAMLDGVTGKEFEKTPPAQYVLAILTDVKRPAALRATALRMLPPIQAELDAKLLSETLASENSELRHETVRTLQFSLIPERFQMLRSIAANLSLDASSRADAVAGLAGNDAASKTDVESRALLLKLAAQDNQFAVRLEAIRSIRKSLQPTDGNQSKDGPQDELALLSQKLAQGPESERTVLLETLRFGSGPRTSQSITALVAEVAKPVARGATTGPESLPYDAVAAGRRTFFHVNSAGCYKCHMVGGRGGQVGPDLTFIARTMDRKKLAESILEPSREISPQYTTWAIETKNGKVLTGMLLGEEVNGDLRLGNHLGDVFFVPFNDIATRVPMNVSIMPEKLHETMSITELRDLVTFLETLK